MASIIFIAVLSFSASLLTFFSGFGLGTILLPAMALFFPISTAIVLTGIVHFINGTAKVLVLRRHIHFFTLWRFGCLAIPAAFLGASLLTNLEHQTAFFSYTLFGKDFFITPLKLTVGMLMIVFTCIEMIPRFKNASIHPQYLPLGGLVSGFFGGLTGHQGAFRSMFLVRAGLTKEQFIATGSAFSFLVDLTRLSVYFGILSQINLAENLPLLISAVASALLGVFVGNRSLKKVDLKFIRQVVSASILLLGVLIAVGMI